MMSHGPQILLWWFCSCVNIWTENKHSNPKTLKCALDYIIYFLIGHLWNTYWTRPTFLITSLLTLHFDIFIYFYSYIKGYNLVGKCYRSTDLYKNMMSDMLQFQYKKWNTLTCCIEVEELWFAPFAMLKKCMMGKSLAYKTVICCMLYS